MMMRTVVVLVLECLLALGVGGESGRLHSVRERSNNDWRVKRNETLKDLGHGLIGVHVEVLNDIAFRVAPVSEAEADAMLRELRGYRLLEGVRGAAPRDIEALRDALVRLSWLAHDQQASLVELDINPLVLYERGAGAKVVDALIVRRGGDGNTGA